ncbi:MAG: hypothetical protein ABIV42_01875, partial [Nitrosospira sp.]
IPLSLLLRKLQKSLCNWFYIKPFVLGQAIVKIFQKHFARELSAGIMFIPASGIYFMEQIKK